MEIVRNENRCEEVVNKFNNPCVADVQLVVGEMVYARLPHIVQRGNHQATAVQVGSLYSFVLIYPNVFVVFYAQLKHNL